MRIGGLNIAEVCALDVERAARFFQELTLNDWQREVGRSMLQQVESRLGFLERVGVGYLTLDRLLPSLSGGEFRRVALTSALGSSLVNMLYVLDEPSIGLHPRDLERLVAVCEGLRDRGNTVAVVEHEEAMIRTADRVVEIGPGAGERGGRVVFEGTPDEIVRSKESLTGQYLTGERGGGLPSERRPARHGWIRLTGARGRNLRNLDVEFPLGVLCLVTGVSGSGKSTLVHHTLYPALRKRLDRDRAGPARRASPSADRPSAKASGGATQAGANDHDPAGDNDGERLPYDDVFGDGQIDDVILVDQSPIARSSRSNPVTYVKAFDEIRALFAATLDARTRNVGAGQFSFNVDGGRCPHCRGEGQLQIDMQFLADVFVRCPECHGTRYRKEILQITHRGRNIAEVLDMTVREAFAFFRGKVKIQARLQRLIDVGLDYLRLGQPANTLSGGESQRLKLAAKLGASKRSRCLFLLDEPTTGLHFSDVVQLIDCFDQLLAVGHSLIVVEHNLQLMKAADYIIDLGPEAADDGGRIVATGTPEEVAEVEASVTGGFLADALWAARSQATSRAD